MPMIVISNCNNIKEACIVIENNKLNIKYGINGTGKSTIAKALKYRSNLKDLNSLLPFKLIENNPDNIQPGITGAEEYNNIMIFDESYIEQFTFQQDELVKNSFEIFIKDDKYQENIDAIEMLFTDVKSIFRADENLVKIIGNLQELSNSFSSTSGGMAKSGKMYKAFGMGNKIENIPEGLECYTEYLKSEQNTAWIKWQTSGNNFLEISSNCPFCTSSIDTKKETIKLVATEYDDKTVGYLLNIIKVMENLKAYFTDESQVTIEKITKNKTGISDLESNFLKNIKNEIDSLLNQLLKLQHLAFFSFHDVDDMVKQIKKLQIDLYLVPSLNSQVTQNAISPLNESLDQLIEKAGLLKGKINLQKKVIGERIEQYQDEIQEFLKFAGYKYTITIEESQQEYKMKLKHEDMEKAVEKGNQHLSYGERNAFALILFMYDCLAKNPDLIILDDPISSFDKNKKFAIIERLFRNNKEKESFKKRTVLMLTHDIDPIIDMFKVLYSMIEPVPVASFLSNKQGMINELPISKNDLKTFAQVCMENIESCNETINKLIYLRRYFEVLDDKSEAYQLLASLFHKRDIPTQRDEDGNKVEMTEEEISKANSKIKEHIDSFDYSEELTKAKDKNFLKSLYDSSQNNYEKLQIYRMIYGEADSVNTVVQKFINETYHIENEYVSQLNPRKYEMIPEFIIEQCTNYINQS
ncbi:MAG: hypothetical protein H6Q35_2609 [Proteobacteria bacterium]|nr:hypothetical protein [Pseudomonadota bacterium]